MMSLWYVLLEICYLYDNINLLIKLKEYKMEQAQKYTREGLSDEEITIDRVEKRLAEISKRIKESNALNLSDINIICEEVFGNILNKLFNLNLIALTAEVSSTYVAVDLVDEGKRVAYQVTSRRDRGKISETITKFKTHKLWKKIDELNVLVLNIEPHEYQNGDEEIDINTEKKFTFDENVINFKRLIDLIEKKEKSKKGFIIEVYDDIGMVFDSGRLSYESIVEKTISMQECVINDYNMKKGLGDVVLYAHLPQNYKETVACAIEFRQSDVTGIAISIGQSKLLTDYFVGRKEFEEKHFGGREINDDEMGIQIENVRMTINAHTAFHLLCLFEDLWKEYQKCIEKFEIELGVVGMEKCDGGYYITEISKTTWHEIMEFARMHDWGDPDGNKEWNIFNCNCSRSSFSLSPFMYGEDARGDVLAEIKVKEKTDEKVGVYWSPGFRTCSDDRHGFDNKMKWKADFTQEWFIKKMLPEIEKQQKKNRTWWRR